MDLFSNSFFLIGDLRIADGVAYPGLQCKKGPRWLLRVFVGDDILVSYGGGIISYTMRIPVKQPVYNGNNLLSGKRSFFRGSNEWCSAIK